MSGNLRRDARITPPPRPAARVRGALAADCEGIGRVYVDSWRTAYSGMLPEDYLAGLSYAEQTRHWEQELQRPGIATFVAEGPAGEVVGFASGGPERSGRVDYFGELYTLYLLESYQGQGIGRAMLGAFAGRLVGIGLHSMLAWVLQGNSARRFYARLGGQELASRPVRVGGSTFIEVAYGWRDARRLAAPAHD